jgi:hypothetical protein
MDNFVSFTVKKIALKPINSSIVIIYLPIESKLLKLIQKHKKHTVINNFTIGWWINFLMRKVLSFPELDICTFYIRFV